MSDPDLIPRTETLRNLSGLTDPERLAEFEATKTSRRKDQLQFDPIKGSFDFAHLKETHRRIFQDIYPFAGQPPSTPIRKAEEVLSGGSVDYEHPPASRLQKQRPIFPR